MNDMRFRETEADSETPVAWPTTQWPPDIIVSDEYLHGQRVVNDTTQRFHRRANGVDSRYPGAPVTPIEPMPERRSNADLWVAVAALALLVVFFVGNATGWRL